MKKNQTLFRLIVTAIFTWLISFQPILAQTVTYTDALYNAGFNLAEQNRSGVSIGYSIHSFTISPIEINGREMNNLELPGFWLPNDEGAPNLPGGGRYIAIPQGSTPVLRIVSQRTETFRNIEIAPAPRIPLDTDNGPLVYPTRSDIYNTNDYYPSSPVKLSETSKIRGVDVVMLGITPFQYNPVTKELLVYKDIEIEIDFQGGNGQIGEDRLRSFYWDQILEDAVLNHESIPEFDYSARVTSANRSGNGCDYLIIVPDGPEYMNWAQQIKTFRIKQGITTEIRTLTEVGGNTAAIIEAYINNAYNTWDPVPAAILLMADYGSNQNTNIMSPIWDSYCVSDNIYGDVDNDDMPEIIMARMVANNNTELETFCTKFLNYEINPPTNPGFYENPITALGWQTERWFQICSETVGGYFKNVHGKNPVRINAVYGGNPNYDPWSTATNTGTILNFFGPSGLGYIPATPQELGGWTGGTATAVNNAINNGAFILQHRDHGGETGWGEPDYSNSNINGLTNTDLCFVFSINCLTGKYNWSGECFSEKFHRYRYNNVNSGALGVICASEVSYSFVNDTYVWGLFDNMWPDFMPVYGSTPEERGLLPAFGNAAGKYFLQQSSWPYNTSNKEVTYNLFHHFGDAFQTLYSEVPQELDINHDGIILAMLDEFTITANEGSTICLTANDSIIGLATGTGAPLTIEIIPQEVGTYVTITVTKTNYFRFEEELQVIPAEGAYLLYGSHVFGDENGGNGNGILDFNEYIDLSLNIRNVGMEDGVNVTVTVSTDDPFITFSDDTEFAEIIPAGQTITLENAFAFHVAEETPDQHLVTFNITCNDGTDSWTSLFMQKVNSVQLNINSMVIDDSANGNGNGKLDPGEQATMTFNYTNTGHAIAYDVDVYLEGQSGYVEVLNPLQNFESITFFGDFTKTFDVVMDAVLPEGIVIEFLNELQLGGLRPSRIFSEKIGEVVEDFETGNFSKFDWQFAGSLPWDIVTTNPYDGTHCARSGDITSNQTTELNITYELFASDSVIFMGKVSSEPNDKLQFFIGDELMGEWAGTGAGWQRRAFLVPEGLQTMRWVYAKDGSSSGGSDMAWLDHINLPAPVCLTIWAGPDSEICEGETFQPVKAYGNNYTSAHWTTSGNGTFNDAYQIQPVYTPGSQDLANGSVTLTLILNGDDGTVTDAMILSFRETPEAPGTPQGPDYIDLFSITTSEYSSEGLPDISEYTWYLSPDEAGTVEADGLSATVTWNLEYLGTAYISMAGINDCGEGEESEPLAVTVDNTVGLNDPDGNGLALSIYPNPGSGRFNLMISAPAAGPQQLRLTNILGETILEKQVNISNSLHYLLNLEEMPDGIYFLWIGNDVQNVIRKLVKN